MPIARAAAALSPTVRTTSPQRVLRSAQPIRIAIRIPTKNSGLTSSALLRLGLSVQPPSGKEGKRGGVGWVYGLPEKKATPRPNSVMGVPREKSVPFGGLQYGPCRDPRGAPAPARAGTPYRG